MNLKKELENLKPYIVGDDEKFNEHFARIFDGCTSNAERKELTDFVEAALAEKEAEVDNAIKSITVRTQLLNNIDMIPLSYIAENYFHKSPQWLYQRVNANIVNGKPACFTQGEVQVFNSALRDVGKKIGSITIK